MSNKGNGNGVGFFGLLLLLFVALKLIGYIDWSWWWVLSPMLAELGLFIAVGVLALASYLANK